jgi:hypothetical protein
MANNSKKKLGTRGSGHTCFLHKDSRILEQKYVMLLLSNIYAYAFILI